MRADVAIITTRADEFQAVLKCFVPNKPRKGSSGRTYGICQVKTRNEKKSTVVLVRCSEDGNDASQQVTNDVIRDWDPHILLVVGIAGGVPLHGFTLGDVIISSRIHNLNVSALQANRLGEFDIRGGTHPLISDIVASLPLYAHLLDDWNKGESMGLLRPAIPPTLSSVLPNIDSVWQKRISISLDWHFGKAENRSRAPIFETGSIASSNTMIRDPHPLIQWLQSARSILAVEMEAAGVYQAAQQMHKQYPVMVIRGISDIIGLERDPQWVIYACETAASFAYAFVAAGIIDADTSLTVTDEAIVTASLSLVGDPTITLGESLVQTKGIKPSSNEPRGAIQDFGSPQQVESSSVNSPKEDLQSGGRSIIIGGPSGIAEASAIEKANITQRLPLETSLDHFPSLARLKTAFQKVGRDQRRLTFVCCALLVILGAGLLLSYNFFVYQPYADNTCNPVESFKIGSVWSSSPFRAVRAPDGQCAGISNGTFAFDTKRADSQTKSEAAQAFRGGNTALALSKWQEALQADTSDAEVGIYLQDQQVIASGQPYITFIVLTTLTGDDLTVSVGRDMLQGAYVAQKEYNDAAQAGNNNLLHLPNQVRVVLYVANVSWVSPECPDTCAGSVVSQIIQAANADEHIKGVIGWPSVSSPALIQKLTSAGLSIISTTSSDWSGVSSSSFFHVAPTLQDQTAAAATYATTSLHVKTAALFSDLDNPYSSTLAHDFKQHFEQAGGSIIYAGLYTVNHAEISDDSLHAALQVTPDLIYFAGYANDISQFITNLQRRSESPPPVMGGDALYSPGGYTPGALAGFNRLYFTASAYPDERSSSNTTFFSNYAQDFDPGGKHQGSPYGYTRPDGNVMLSYDAILAFLSASSQLLTGANTDFTTQALQQTLGQIQDLQGLSGLITFASPSPKAVVVLWIQDEKNMFAGGDQQNSIVGSFSCSPAVEVGISCPNS